ncbi:pogo transposable element, putative [Metarhizium acridum CQMa 102]|uniref:Pogo transposable element, putative n=1 Tax=Metarhizium acridum (strain CQMa 102) TaxID=655827 RepID=E9DXA8_METAQ|nr:pogo transposable element, putative [Metarhizium acridum CQMa 102]EFY91666.1 pogo transposable element, putative [Metarhizium acridum CQMa 102]
MSCHGAARVAYSLLLTAQQVTGLLCRAPLVRIMKLEKGQNLNFTLPEGTTNHGDPHLLCFPATWNSIAVFMIGNYLALAATVKTPPASSPFATAWIMLGALLVPSTGLVFGMSAFYQARKGHGESGLRKATLERALCIISFDLTARHVFCLMKAVDNNNDDDDDDDEQQSEEMQPVPEDVSLSDSTAVGQGGSQQPTETAVIFTTRASNLVNPDSEIYVEPPPVAGYVLAYMPVDSIVDPVAEPCPGLRTLGLLTKRRNATKSLVALLQLCFSVFVLARARGDQVALYGVAAFSLSVAPYAVMAAVNLLANAFVPQYDCLFLVENDVMQEMRSQHGFQFDGVAGKLRQTEKGEAVTLHPLGQGGSQPAADRNGHSEIYVEPPPVAGYVLAYMPVDSIVDPVAEPCPGLRTLGLLTKRRNATKSLVALLQLCFSVFVLARARGDQVALYGVAAFSLSVAPYAVMAAVNLLANAFVPQYDCLFLVENDVMQEMRSQHGFQFDGVAGKLRQTEKGEAVTLHPPGEADEGLKSSGFLGFPDSSKTRGCGCLLRTKPYRTASYQMYASQSVQPKRLSAWVAGGTSTSKLQGTLQSGNAYVAFLCCDSTSNKE